MDAEYHKKVIVKDVARQFGRQDSTSVNEMLLGGMEANDRAEESTSPESPVLMMDKTYQKEYMSPIVSFPKDIFRRINCFIVNRIKHV